MMWSSRCRRRDIATCPQQGIAWTFWLKTNAALSQYYQTGKRNLPDSDPNNIYTSNTLGPNQDVHGLDWLLNDPTVDDYAKVEDFIKKVMVDGNKSQFSASTISTVLGLILNNWDPGPDGGSSPSPTYQAKVQEFGQMVNSVGTVETTPGQGEIKTEELHDDHHERPPDGQRVRDNDSRYFRSASPIIATNHVLRVLR